jgi:hypothetical protein
MAELLLVPPKIKRPMYPPGHPKGPTSGKDVQIMKWGIHRYETGVLPRPEDGFTEDFGQAMKEALKVVIQPAEGIEATGAIGQATFDVLWQYLDAYRRDQYRRFRPPVVPTMPPVPSLGQLYAGSASPMSHSLTHRTSGLAGKRGSVWPAYDDGWIIGRTILAVEDMTVIEQSSSAGGDAFFARGESKLEFWYGHLAWSQPTGRDFERGEPIGKIASMPRAHVHLAISAVQLIGHDLAHHTDYSHGAPLVGAQLREALSL